MNKFNRRSHVRWAWAGLGLLLAPMPDPASAFDSAKPTQRIEYWQQRERDIDVELGRMADLPAVRLVFVGDSITDFWQMGADLWVQGRLHGRRIWDESFGAGANPANRALNLGVSGDRTEHILFRILPQSQGGRGELDEAALQPDYMILMAGINNTWAQEDQPVEAIVDGVTALVSAIHARKPNARIIIQSLLPTNDAVKNRDLVGPINRRLASLASSAPQSGYAAYLDLYPGFVDASGRQITALFVDGLHPSEAGYRIWRDRLMPFLEQDRKVHATKARP